MMLKTGDKAPAFSLMSDSAGEVSTSALKGKRYVLYFYPKDDTPGCTVEACTFRDNLPKFGDLGVPIYGVSADDLKAHAKFTAKFSLNFPLLSDPSHAFIESYGAWVEKSMYGRKYFGVQRSTFVISPAGKIEQVWEKIPDAEAHVYEVLAYLKGEPAPAVAAKKPAPKKVTAPKTVLVKLPSKKVAAKKTPTKKQ